MRALRIASVAAACGLVALFLVPATAAAQTCSPPRLGTAASKRTLRSSRVITLGTMGSTAPSDAHGIFSFVVTVDRYLRGSGPPRAEFTVYEGSQAPLSQLQPGSSIAQSRAVATRWGGQRVLVTASPESDPFSGQFAIDRCAAYAFYGDAAVARALPMVERLLGGTPPPAKKMPRTGGPPAPGLVFGVGAVLCGIMLRRGARRRVLAGSYEFLASASESHRARRRRQVL